MKTNPQIFLFACLSTLLMGCSDLWSKGDGTGTGSETTNEIAGVIRDSMGRPVPNTHIRLYRTESDSTFTQDSTQSDQRGAYAFRALPNGIYSLEGRSLDQAMAFWGHGLELSSNSKIEWLDTLLPMGSASGSCVWPTVAGAMRIKLYETPWIAEIQTTGHWQFDSLPAGQYHGLIQIVDSASGFWATTSIIPISIISNQLTHIDSCPQKTLLDSGSLVLDDFNDLDKYNNIGLIWWSYNDSAKGGSSRVLNPLAEEMIQWTDSLRQGALGAQFEFGSPTPRYVGVGCYLFRPIGMVNTTVNLSSLTRVILRTRGMQVQASLHLLSPLSTTHVASWTLSLSDSWTLDTLDINSNEVESTPTDPWAWDRLSPYITQFLIILTPLNGSSQGEFWIDDIILETD